MKFRYELEVKKMAPAIDHSHRLFLVGSCFTENIGEKLLRSKFSVFQNPHGILFNPVSVADNLTDVIEGVPYDSSQLFYHNELWHSWKHHSRYSAVSESEALRKMNESLAAAHDYLKQSDYIMITLGSAWVYSLTDIAPGGPVGRVVANNHKGPAGWFNKRLLTTEDVLRVLDNLIHRLFHFNPRLRIIFTISPVRHLREGAIENNRSKAVLIQAVHHLVDKFEKLYYFPAYELVIDDLRDYRFYAEDLVHPNYFATQYVWEKFTSATMSEETLQLIAELQSIQTAFQHKPFNPSSVQHREFLRRFYEKTMALQLKHPHIDLHSELNFFRTDN